MTAKHQGTGPEAEFRRIPECGGAEVLCARYRQFTFRKHAHARLAIGTVGAGALRIDMARGAFVAEAGTVITFNPDIIHWGGGVDDTPWIQNLLLIDEAEFSNAMEAIRGHRTHDKFERHSMQHPALFRRFARLHRLLRTEVDPLRRETEILLFLGELTKDAGLVRNDNTPGNEPKAVNTARDYIDAHVSDPIRLDDIAAEAGMTGFQLTRAFNKALGMPPHAYQVHRRVHLAERLLRQGLPPADVAAECGFSDQAHLTRAFRQSTGLTPAKFQRG